MNNKYHRQTSLLLISLAALLVSMQVSSQQLPVRNDVPRIGQREVVMMRHAYLDEGGYDYWYEQSSTKVWPWFERLGTRIMGDFQIVYPESDDATPGQDEALRFARYASYEHWQATRPNATSGDAGGSGQLAGNGPLFDDNNAGLSNRRQVLQGSRGGFFLQGYMAEDRPIYMPGLGENYQQVSGAASENSDEPLAVRLNISEPRDEIMVLEYRKVNKGSFEEFHAISSTRSWPYLEKIGARPVGQWHVAYLPNSPAEETDDYDEIFTLIRYSSYAHYQAVRDNAISMGGNGPDYQLKQNADSELDNMTQERSVEFLQGPLWESKPHYTPAMNENYRITN